MPRQTKLETGRGGSAGLIKSEQEYKTAGVFVLGVELCLYL